MLDAPSGETPSNINVIYTLLKYTFNGLQFRRWHYVSILIRLAAVGWLIDWVVFYVPSNTVYVIWDNGRRFLQVKRPNQQYQSTEGESWKENNTKT